MNTVRRTFAEDDSDQEQVTRDTIPDDTTRRRSKKKATKAPGDPPNVQRKMVSIGTNLELILCPEHTYIFLP